MLWKTKCRSLNSTSDDIQNFQKKINALKTQVKELESFKKEVNDLGLEVTELRLEFLPQQQRQNLRGPRNYRRYRT